MKPQFNAKLQENQPKGVSYSIWRQNENITMKKMRKLRCFVLFYFVNLPWNLILFFQVCIFLYVSLLQGSQNYILFQLLFTVSLFQPFKIFEFCFQVYRELCSYIFVDYLIPKLFMRCFRFNSRIHSLRFYFLF